MRQTTVFMLAAVGLATTGSAAAKPPPPQTQTVAYRDATPDPTGYAVGPVSHCSGLLPREAAYKFTAPARGTLKASLAGFQGVWGMDIADAKGNVLTDTDSTNGPVSLSVKAKARGAVLNVAPCNMAGSPDATITLVFTFA